MILDPDPASRQQRAMGRCDNCGVAIDVARAFPLAFPCHAVARGVFCLRCYDHLANRHTPHVWLLSEPD